MNIEVWQKGFFDADGLLLAQLERHITRDIDLEVLRAHYRQLSGGAHKGLRTLEAVQRYAQELVSNPDPLVQRKALDDLLFMVGPDERTEAEVLRRWTRHGDGKLADFAPYASFVQTTHLTFTLGLECEVIPTGKGAFSDLEYLCYLPFCTAFSSNDNLHKCLCPLLLRSDQEFLSLSELKCRCAP